jgi:hypothetical protein
MKSPINALNVLSQVAKILLLIGTVFCFSMLTSCSNQEQIKSEVIQYEKVVKNPLDGPVKQVVMNANVEVPKEIQRPTQPAIKRMVNKAPNQTLEELSMEVTLMEEQGADRENAALVYNQYGDELMKADELEEAKIAYQKAEDNDYKDLKTLCFKIARLYALNEKYGSAEDYLIKARENGFRNYRALLYDAAFVRFRSDYEFMYLYDKLFGDKKKAMFKAFVTLGPKKKLTKDYIISPVALFENTEYNHRKKVNYYEKHPSIDAHFGAFAEGIGEGRFSRGGGDHYRYELVLDNSEKYVAVIYSEEEEWVDYILPKKYQLVTYDKEGNKISELEIAKRGSLSKCKGVVFQPNNTIKVTNYKVAWVPGAKTKSIDSEINMTYKDLKSVKSEDTKTYRINDDGRILEVEDMLIGMN